MARAKSGSGDNSLLGGLRNSPEGKRLAEEARGFLDAHANRITSKLGTGVGSATEKLTNLGESGGLPSLGEGAKQLMSGKGPVRSVLGAATSGVADKAKDLVGKNGGGEPKATNIEESIDIGRPVSDVYDQWTQFQDFSRFTKGVETVDQQDDTKVEWRGKVFKSRRSWTAKIREQVPDRRIVWTAKGNKGAVNGVVTFHPLADDLTRVLVALEYYPSGVVEKTGNMWRAVGRRVRLDLKNFRRFVMMRDQPTGAWRGEIHKGRVEKKSSQSRQSSSGSSQQRSSSGSPQKRSSSAARKRSSSSPAQKQSSSSPQKRSASSTQKRSSSAARKRSSSSPAQKQSSSGSAQKRSSSGSPQKRSSSGSPRKRSSSGSPQQRSSSNSPQMKSESSRPAKKSTSSRPAKKSASSRPAKKSESRPRKSASAGTRPAKSTSQRSSARKSSSQRSSGGATRKSTSSSSGRKRSQSAKRPAARKRTSR